MKTPSLSTQVFLGLLIGALLGHLFPEFALATQPLSTIFLRMIKMLIVPLLFAMLVLGIAGTSESKNLGRMGVRVALYFVGTTIFALIVGLTAANLLQPGQGLSLDMGQPTSAALAEITSHSSSFASQNITDILVHMFPTSVVDAMAKGEVLQVVVFSVFFGLGLASLGKKGKPLLDVLENVSQVMFTVVGYVMRFAPLGVMAAIAVTVSTNGLGILLGYLKLVLSLYAALIVFAGSIMLVICTTNRIPITKFLAAVREPWFLAFSTASSEAALPKAMANMEAFGVPRGIVSFVLPVGYSFNLDGSILYLALATLFIAQMAGIDFTLQQQIAIMITLMITSKGIAAVPRASLVILAGTASAFGLPIEGIIVLLGIDQLLDMGRTSVNLVGNCMATTIIARWEGVLDDKKMQQYA